MDGHSIQCNGYSIEVGGGRPIARTYDNESRHEEAEKRRRRILDAARRLFALHGYAATAVARIAHEADVSTQTVYNRVGSKQDVLAALHELVDYAGDVARIQRRIAECDDAREVVALAARIRRLMMEGAGDIVAFSHAAAATDPAVASAYAAGQARSRAGITLVAQRLASLGALRRDVDVEEAADAAYALLHHAIWVRLVDECGWSADEAERWYTEVLTRALLETERWGNGVQDDG